MATSSFTKNFVLGKEEAIKLAELLEDDKPNNDRKEQTEVVYADKEFIKKCFMQLS